MYGRGSMTEPNEDLRTLDLFGDWLRSLGTSASTMAQALDAASPESKPYLVGGLNYIFKSLDLIPDGIDDLGYLDDAFVVRVASSLASRAGDVPASIQTLAEGTSEIETFLKNDYARLERYVTGLTESVARQRSVQDICGDAATQTEFVREIEDWAKAYTSPTFTKEPRVLLKLRSFLSAKLP